MQKKNTETPQKVIIRFRSNANKEITVFLNQDGLVKIQAKETTINKNIAKKSKNKSYTKHFEREKDERKRKKNKKKTKRLQYE